MKVEPQCLVVLLIPLAVLEWKWKVISMDFITRFPKTMYQHDSIMVVVDALSKATQFIDVKYTFGTTEILNIFMKDILDYMAYQKR